ncbi:MAG TPA: DUF72 domain-containing protein [Xanthobacteraceae bacterium]|nr:DUF72 domain-containing protein [Xanthobacteraceae bacterium]
MTAARLRVGTSGYQYDHWRGVFYPADLPKSQWFAFYARHFDTVEINNTFYRLPGPHVFDAWAAAAPPRFLYALKFSRYGTHRKRLRDPARLIELFLSRARRLKSCLGPVLVQLPPRWQANAERLEAFLAAVPQPPRWVIEFRDPSWLSEPIFALLAKYKVALCVHDMIPDHPRRLTADFTYLRFHGRAYGGSYTPQQLAAQARRIRGYLADGIHVYAYFNNDAGGHAVRNALDLRRYVTGAEHRAVA